MDEIERVIEESQTDRVPDVSPDPRMVAALANRLIEAGLADEVEETLFRSFLKHEAEWRRDYGDDDPDVRWLEEMKRKHAGGAAGS